MTRILTFARALGRLIWALVTRQPVFVSADEAAARLNTCETKCQHFDTVDRKCQLCQCYVDAKSLFATEDCPKKLWPRIYDILFS